MQAIGHRIAMLGASVLFGLGLPVGAMANAPVGSPCFCAQVCAALGAPVSSWVDPAGATVHLANCPPAQREQMWQHGRLCSCHNPLDWYRLQDALRPSTSQDGVEKPPYKGP